MIDWHGKIIAMRKSTFYFDLYRALHKLWHNFTQKYIYNKILSWNYMQLIIFFLCLRAFLCNLFSSIEPNRMLLHMFNDIEIENWYAAILRNRNIFQNYSSIQIKCTMFGYGCLLQWYALYINVLKWVLSLRNCFWSLTNHISALLLNWLFVVSSTVLWSQTISH